MIRIRLGLLLSVAVLGCQRASSEDPGQVRKIIENHNAQAERWLAAGNADSYATLFSEDVWQMPPNNPASVGRAALREWWAGTLKAGTWTLNLSTQDVVTGGNLAAERGTYKLALAAAPGGPIPSFADSGNYVVLWRHEPDGQWRAVWDAPVSVVPFPTEAKPASPPASGHPCQMPKAGTSCPMMKP